MSFEYSFIELMEESSMTTFSLDEKQIKDLVKQAMVELLEERKELFYDLFVEAIEDTALIHAIREGEASNSVSREDVLHALR